MSARFREGGAPARWVKRECLAQAGLEQPGRSSLRSQLRRAARPIGRRRRLGPSIDRNTSSATTFGSGAVLLLWVITAAVRWRCGA